MLSHFSNAVSKVTVALSLAVPMLLSSSAFSIEPGMPAPNFELSGSTGKVSLQRLKGKVVYLDFWASWCGPCKQSFPWMNEMQKRYASKGLQVVAVNLDKNPQDAEQFLSEVGGASFPVVYDPSSSLPKTYGVKNMPTSILIGADGKVILHHNGFRSEDKASLERAFSQALK